jgi:hypothetical protein
MLIVLPENVQDVQVVVKDHAQVVVKEIVKAIVKGTVKEGVMEPVKDLAVILHILVIKIYNSLILYV